MNRFYTSIDESKHLIELGLKAETADMYYNPTDWQHTQYEKIPEITTNFMEGDLPCWSVGQLLELMPERIMIENHVSSVMNLTKVSGGYGVIYDAPELYHQTLMVGTFPIDACYSMMCYLLQNNYIKTE